MSESKSESVRVRLSESESESIRERVHTSKSVRASPSAQNCALQTFRTTKVQSMDAVQYANVSDIFTE